MNDIGFGLWLTLMGMGTVFGLLVLLMVVLRVIGWSDRRSGRRRADVPGRVEPSEVRPSDELTPEQIAAITIAVITHARVRRGQAAPAMRQVPPGSQLFASRWVAVGRSYQNQPWKGR